MQANLSIKKKKNGNESLECRQKSLAKQCQYQKEKTANESVGGRQKRLAKQCQYQKEKTANESAGCREKRLANKRQYQKEKMTNESVGCREKRLANICQYQEEKIANEGAYQEHYLLLKEKIDKQMMQYAVCSEDLHVIEQHLQNTDYNDEHFDSIAPNTTKL